MVSRSGRVARTASAGGVGPGPSWHALTTVLARSSLLVLVVTGSLLAVGPWSLVGAANSDLSFAPGNGRITVVWSPSGGTAGTLKATATSGTTKVSCSSSANSCVLAGLTNGVSYSVTATVTDSS